MLALRFRRLDIDAKYTFAEFRDSLTVQSYQRYKNKALSSMNPYLKRPMMFSDNWPFLYILFEFELSFFFNSGFENNQPRFINGHSLCNHVIGIAQSAVKKIMWVVSK